MRLGNTGSDFQREAVFRDDYLPVETFTDLCRKVQQVGHRVDMREDDASDSGFARYAGGARRRQVARYAGVIREGALDQQRVRAAGQLDYRLAVLGIPRVHERAALRIQPV